MSKAKKREQEEYRIVKACLECPDRQAVVKKLKEEGIDCGAISGALISRFLVIAKNGYSVTEKGKKMVAEFGKGSTTSGRSKPSSSTSRQQAISPPQATTIPSPKAASAPPTNLSSIQQRYRDVVQACGINPQRPAVMAALARKGYTSKQQGDAICQAASEKYIRPDGNQAKRQYLLTDKGKQVLGTIDSAPPPTMTISRGTAKPALPTQPQLSPVPTPSTATTLPVAASSPGQCQSIHHMPADTPGLQSVPVPTAAVGQGSVEPLTSSAVSGQGIPPSSVSSFEKMQRFLKQQIAGCRSSSSCVVGDQRKPRTTLKLQVPQQQQQGWEGLEWWNGGGEGVVVEESGFAVEHTTHNTLHLPQAPFAMTCVGNQGAGKSNTQNVIIESLLSVSASSSTSSNLKPETKPNSTTATMVFHYDKAGAGQPMEHLGLCGDPQLLAETVVLTSPTCRASHEMYCEAGVATMPILLDWGKLSAVHLQTLMHIDPAKPQLYASKMMSLLRTLEKAGGPPPELNEFKRQLKEGLELQQWVFLEQRFAVLEEFLAGGTSNAGGIAIDLETIFQQYRLVLVDLSDPLLTQEDVNAIIFILLNNFRALYKKSKFKEEGVLRGKFSGFLSVFDEAHKYLADQDGHLCSEIVNLVENMRHEDHRVIITTQLPSVIPDKIHQLVTFAVIHHLHAPELWRDIQQSYNLPKEDFELVENFTPGEALIFASSSFDEFACPRLGKKRCRVLVNRRQTVDLGETRTQ